jgi:hypothetical protein
MRDTTSENSIPAAKPSSITIQDDFSLLCTGSGTAVLRRTMRRVVSEENLESLASVKSSISISRCGSSVSRSGSSDWWSRVSEVPVALQLRRHVEVVGSADPLKRDRSSGAVLPDWPAVDHDSVASGKRHLLTFDLDPTTLPSDVLCHLAMEMFVSAGLPTGVDAESVRRFILAARASMPDNPYHNFYHVFDVMQTTNALATSSGTMARLDAWERFALLSAALW